MTEGNLGGSQLLINPNNSCVGTQVYTGQEFQEEIMVNGLSVGDQFVVSLGGQQSRKNFKWLPSKTVINHPGLRILRQAKSFPTRP